MPDVLVDPRVSRRTRAAAGMRRGRGLIRLSPAVAEEPAEYLRDTIAHEAGHLALGHHPAAHTAWALTVGIPLWASAITCCVMGVQHSSTQQASLWFGLAVVPALLAMRLIVIPSRRGEIAADRWSSNAVGTASVLRTLAHLDSQCGPFVRLAAHIGMDTHPSPKQRARRLHAGRSLRA